MTSGMWLEARRRRGARQASIAALAAAIEVASAHAQDATVTTQFGGPTAQQQAYCRQLERDLPPDWQQAAGGRDLVPRIEAQMARADQQVQHAQALAEHSDCFDYFLFSKTWRNTATCQQIRQQIDDGQRSLADLDRQRKAASASQDRGSRADALLTELVRNQCGPQYTAALQRQSGAAAPGTGAFWNDSEGQGPAGANPGFQSLTPGSTFRTICVRTCDGYYFPISFAAPQERIEHDAQVCQSRCSGPSKLYYYPNPGGEVQQAVGLDGTAYTALPNAFRYRKELVAKCTCQAPSDGQDTNTNIDAPSPFQPIARPGDKRANGFSPAPAPAARGADNSDALPAAEFGTLTVEPAPTAGEPGKAAN